MAPLTERITSISCLRENLQRLLEDSPYERSNADLAVFLDDLLASDGARARRARSSVWRPLTGSAGRDADQPGASRAVWALRIAAGIVSLATLAAVDLAVHHREPPRAAPSAVATQRPSVARPQAPEVQPERASEQEPEVTTAESLPSPSTAVAVPARVSVKRLQSSARRAASELAQAWRLRAALSRVSAQTFDAWNLASEPFRAGKVNEQEGERLLTRRQFAAAHEAFERAAQLYTEAEELSHQERARVIRVSSLESRLAPPQRF